MKSFLVLFLCVCGVCVYMRVWGALVHVGVDGGLGWTVECLPSRFSALFLNFLTAIVAIGANQQAPMLVSLFRC